MDTGQRILELLPATSTQLQVALGMAQSTVHKWVSRMHASGAIYVRRYLRTGGQHAPLWAVGPGRNAVRLKPWSKAYCEKRRCLKLKQLGLYQDLLLERRLRAARKKALANASKQSYTNDPLLAFFYKRLDG